MNKIIINAKKTFTVLTLTAACFAGSLAAHAASGHEPKKHNAGSASTAEVFYVGSLEGQPLFTVMYNNAEGSRFSISITDAQGYELFRNSYSDKKFDKKFEIADVVPEGKLMLTIRNYKDNSEQTFEINANTLLVEDVEVKEVK
jgi:hypothetical protein